MIEIIEFLFYFLKLSVQTELLWIVLPLIIATIVMLFYFEKYEEKPGWNSYVANSLVLLFVGMIMLRQIYNIGNAGAINYIDYPAKFFVSITVLIVAMIIFFLNFQRFLPEKIARIISSPLTINLLAYVLLLYVFSGIEDGIQIILSLVFLYLILLIILNLIKIPLKKLFKYLKKMKEKEKIQEIKDKKSEAMKTKEQLEKEEKFLEKKKNHIKKTKKQIQRQTKKEEKEMLKEFDKQKKQAIKLKKIVRKPLKKSGKKN